MNPHFAGRVRLAAGLLLLGVLGLPAIPRASDEDRLARGRYITHDVAMCVQCHTPRDRSGALIEEEEFMGAPFPLPAPSFIPQGAWCISTPRIAGLPGFTDAEAVEFFMNGARLGRHQPKWPMPPFHLSRADAEAVVAYLRSLPERGVAPSSAPAAP
jgi:mono/diheme cytochrome c family protein